MNLEWHAQPASLTLRLLPAGGFGRVPFVATVQVELLGLGWAYLHAALRADTITLRRQDIAAVARLLHTAWGVSHVLVVRHGAMETVDIKQYFRQRGSGDEAEAADHQLT